MIRPDRSLGVLLRTIRWVRDNAALSFVTSAIGFVSFMLAAARVVTG